MEVENQRIRLERRTYAFARENKEGELTQVMATGEGARHTRK